MPGFWSTGFKPWPSNGTGLNALNGLVTKTIRSVKKNVIVINTERT